MQVTETLNEGLKRAYSIVVSASELNESVEDKLREAQPEVELKGFRKGKVPLPLLKKQFGKRLMGEAMQESIDGAMSKHFENSGDKPAMQPEVKMTNEDWQEGDDVHVDLSYEALPDVPEINLKSIKLERMIAKADEEAIKEALDNLAQTSKDFKARGKTAKAKEGDQVVIDFLGKVDEEAFEGGSAEDYPLVLGSNSFIPGFEDQLLGSKSGEEKNVEVTFPLDYGNANLSGKVAIFKCKIKSISQPVAAKINDELATKFGAENLITLKGQITERLEEEYAGAARAVMKRRLLDILDKMVAFDLPPSLLQVESKQIANQLWQEENAEVERNEETEIEVTDEHKELATRRVRLGLLLANLGERANIEVTDQEMQQSMVQQARQYPGKEREFFEFIQKNEQMQQQMRAPLFEDKVIDYVFELAEISEKEVDKDALRKAVEQLENEDS